MTYVFDTALKHGLKEEEVVYAWENAIEHVRCRYEKQPPHYMAIGTLPNGNPCELIGYSDGFDWYVFHAMGELTPGFMHEYEEVSRHGH